MSRTFAAAAVLLVAACASPQRRAEPTAAQAAVLHTVAVKDYTPEDGALIAAAENLQAEDLLLCGIEQPTGTHIGRRICRSEAQLTLVHQATQDWLRTTRAGNGARFTGPGERAFIGQ